MIRYGFGSVLGAMVILVPGTPAHSQEGLEFQLEEIVVTARKREETLQEVPVSITVFTGEALKQAGILTTRDLYANTPGLNYDTGFDQNAATPAIRGVVSNEIATYRQKVTTFLDGMPILGQQGTVPFHTIQQVEVLRGPQSSAFGRSTFGGAINYTTVDPGDTLVADLTMDVGQDSLFNLGAIVSGPIVEGVLSGLVAYESKSRDGESDWVTIDEGYGLGGESSENTLVKLVYTPTEALSLEWRYKNLDVDNEQTPRDFYPWSTVVRGADMNPGDRRQIHPDSPATTCGIGGMGAVACAFVGSIEPWEQSYDYNYSDIGIDDPFVQNQRERMELELTYDFDNGGSLVAMGFSSDEFYERGTDADLYGSEMVNGRLDSAGFERDPTDIGETYYEVRYASPGENRFRYGGGVSFYDYDFLTVVYRSLGGYQRGPTGGRQISEFASNTGYFFNLTYDMTEQFTASLEGRYQNDEVGGNNIAGSGEVTSGSQSTKAFLPRFGLTYTPSGPTTYYLQIAKGNNPAGVNSGWFASEIELAYASYPEFFPVPPSTMAFYEEEEVINTEIGVKGTIADRVSYAVNAYSLNWDNYTEIFRGLSFAPSDWVDANRDGAGDAGTPYAGMDFSASTYLGAGDVTGSGLEFEASAIVTDNFRASAAASYINISYDEGACTLLASNYGVPVDETIAIGDSTIGCNSVAGREIGTQPKLAAVFSLDYRLPLESGREWFTRWSTRYTGAQYASVMNLARLDAFSVSDIRTGLSGDNWRAEAYVNNVFDSDAPQGIQIFFDGEAAIGAPPGPPTWRQNLVYTERRGRAAGLRFSYSFGN